MRFRGVVRFYQHAKGFGFIACDDDGGDCFVSREQLAAAHIAQLASGDVVEFELATDARKRLYATDLKLLASGRWRSAQ